MAMKMKKGKGEPDADDMKKRKAAKLKKKASSLKKKASKKK